MNTKKKIAKEKMEFAKPKQARMKTITLEEAIRNSYDHLERIRHKKVKGLYIEDQNMGLCSYDKCDFFTFFTNKLKKITRNFTVTYEDCNTKRKEESWIHITVCDIGRLYKDAKNTGQPLEIAEEHLAYISHKDSFVIKIQCVSPYMKANEYCNILSCTIENLRLKIIPTYTYEDWSKTEKCST